MSEEELNHQDQTLGEALGEGEADFSAEPAKKPSIGRGTLLLLGLVLAGVGGTYYLYVRGGPGVASASTMAQSRAADQTIHSFLNRADGGRRTMQRLLEDTRKVVQKFMAYPSETQIPLSDLKTNPFRHLPAARPAQQQQQLGRLEAQRQQEAKRAALQKSFQSLKLQSVFLGSRRQTCVINNTLYEQGQHIGDFRIDTIQSGSVVLRCGDERFELKME